MPWASSADPVPAEYLGRGWTTWPQVAAGLTGEIADLSIKNSEQARTIDGLLRSLAEAVASARIDRTRYESARNHWQALDAIFSG